MAMKITYLGTNALLFRKGESAILVDPHFTRPGFLRLLGKIHPDPQAIAAGLTHFGIKRLDGVLLTHTHYDHALDAAEVINQAGGVLYGSESAMNLAKGAGLEVNSCIRVTPGLVYPIAAFKISFLPSRHLSFPVPFSWLMPPKGEIAQPLHPPAWFWYYQCGSVYAILVDQTLVFGSAGFEVGAYQNLKIDSVVMGIGGLDLIPKSYLGQYYNEAVLLPGAKHVFLSHWDNFFRPLDRDPRPLVLARRSIDRVLALGVRYGQTVHLLELGKTLHIG